jgi:hypothetical protein
MRLCCGYDRLRSALAHINGQFPHHVRVLREDATLERVALLTAHGAYVQRICGPFVRRLLKLPAVDELHVGDRRPSRFSGISVLEAAPKSGESLRPIIIERGRCALSDAHALDAHPPGVAGVAGVRPPPAHAIAMMTHAAVYEFVRPRFSATYARGRERVMIKRLPTGYSVGCCGGWTGK